MAGLPTSLYSTENYKAELRCRQEVEEMGSEGRSRLAGAAGPSWLGRVRSVGQDGGGCKMGTRSWQLERSAPAPALPAWGLREIMERRLAGTQSSQRNTHLLWLCQSPFDQEAVRCTL